MAAKFPQDLEEMVTCPVCLGQYQDPRLLPCLHTYCKGCLEKLLEKGPNDIKYSIKCPECREVTQVENVNSLHVNIVMEKNLSLLELFKAEKNQDGEPRLICNNCDSNEPAKARCFDCEKYMCSSCVAAHNRMTVVLKDHRLMTLEEIADTGIPVMDKPRLCDKHKGKKKKLFCEECKVLICRDCTLIDHKDHHFSFITDVIEKHKKQLQSKISFANKQTVQKITSALTTVKDMEERVIKNSENIEQKIDAIIDAKIQALEEKRAALKQESINTTAFKIKRLSTQEDGLLLHLTALKGAVHFTQNVLQNGNTSDILSMKEQLMSRMSALSDSNTLDDEVDKDDQVKLIVAEEEKLLNLDLIRLEDKLAPDPKKCCIKRYDRDESRLVVEVKNKDGTSIPIRKDRIVINCTFDARCGATKYGSFYKIVGVQRSETSYARFCKLEVLIDGQPIKGTPCRVVRSYSS